MINPTSITDYNRTEKELQTFWIFCICVAGKNSDQTACKVGQMLKRCLLTHETPFAWLKENEHAIHNVLVANRIGQYIRVERAIKESLHLNLATATLEELEAVYGVGPKSARFFLLHTRPNQECAVLDTHILTWLRGLMPSQTVPKATPPAGEKYRHLERLFLSLAKGLYPGLSIAEIDLLIWSTQSGRLTVDGPASLQ
jgi:thermostable 8-oxoguanine DNA glycosylase